MTQTITRKRAISLLVLIVLSVSLLGLAAGVSETRHMTNTQHTVNGVTLYNLSTSQTASELTTTVSSGNNGDTVQWGIRIWVNYSGSGGKELTSGTPTAVVSRSTSSCASPPCSGIQTATWDAPEILLNRTDAVTARVYTKVGTGSWSQGGTPPEFITNQLNALRLDAATWTINYFTEYNYGNQQGGFTDGIFHWGSSSSDSHIERFTYAEQVPPTIQSNITYNGTDYQNLKQQNAFIRSDTLTLRANITDRYGDLDQATVTIRNTTGDVVLKNASMANISAITVSGDSGATFERNYSIPDTADVGGWSYTIWANDTKGALSNTVGTFDVYVPAYLEFSFWNTTTWDADLHDMTNLTANVTCKGDSGDAECGSVSGSLRYNDFDLTPDSAVPVGGGSPFFVKSEPQTFVNWSSGWWTAGNTPDLHVEKMYSEVGPNAKSTTNITVNVSNFGQGTWNVNVSLWNYTRGVLNWDNTTVDNRSQYVYTTALADIDGDGDTDVISGDESFNIIFWDNEAGDGSSWTRRRVGTDTSSLNSVSAGDVDGDGDLDVVSGGLSNDVEFWENLNGDGSSWDNTTVGSDTARIRSVGLADVDGDGDLDVMSAGSSNDLEFWENLDGVGGSWDNTTVGSDTSVIYDAALGDMDGDDDIDAVSVGASKDVEFWENLDGVGGSWDNTTVGSLSDNINSVTLGDVDNDGDLDVISGDRPTNDGYANITLWENAAGDGSSWTRTQIGTDTEIVESLTVGDINTDGYTDVISGSREDTSNRTILWENTDGGSTWNKTIIGTDTDGINTVSVGNIDGDGVLDVVSGGYSRDIEFWGTKGINTDFVGSTSVSFTDVNGTAKNATISWTPSTTNYNLLAVADSFNNYTSVFRTQDSSSAVGNRLVQSADLSAGNPIACSKSNLKYGQTCSLTWTVNATEKGSFNLDANFSSNAGWIAENDTANKQIDVDVGYLTASLLSPDILPFYAVQNNTFWWNTTVRCKGEPGDICDTVDGSVRYNESSATPQTLVNETEGATPFYIAGGGEATFPFSVGSQAEWINGLFNASSADRDDNAGDLGIGYTNGTLTDNLVGYWRLDRTSGDVIDYSGWGQPGKIYGGVTRGKRGIFGANAFEFEGNEVEGVNVTDQSRYSIWESGDTGTISAWVRANREQHVHIFSKGGEWSLKTVNQSSPNGVMEVAVDTWGNSTANEHSETLEVGRWTHIVGVFHEPGDWAAIYQNGALVGNVTGMTDTSSDAGSHICISGWDSQADGTCDRSERFDGIIDEARLYNRTLNASEIRQLYFWGGSNIQNAPYRGEYTSTVKNASGAQSWSTVEVNTTIPTNTSVHATVEALDETGNTLDSQLVVLGNGNANYSLDLSNSQNARVLFNGTSTNVTKTWEVHDFTLHSEPAGGSTQECGTISQGDSCRIDWKINATGSLFTSWLFDANFSSSLYPSISDVGTQDTTVKIVDGVVRSTILAPLDNQGTVLGKNTTVNVSLTGEGSVSGCTAEIADPSGITVFGSTQHDVSGLSNGGTNYTIWTIQPSSGGVYDIAVNTTCSSGEAENRTINNFTASDIQIRREYSYDTGGAWSTGERGYMAVRLILYNNGSSTIENIDLTETVDQDLLDAGAQIHKVWDGGSASGNVIDWKNLAIKPGLFKTYAYVIRMPQTQKDYLFNAEATFDGATTNVSREASEIAVGNHYVNFELDVDRATVPETDPNVIGPGIDRKAWVNNTQGFRFIVYNSHGTKDISGELNATLDIPAECGTPANIASSDSDTDASADAATYANGEILWENVTKNGKPLGANQSAAFNFDLSCQRAGELDFAANAENNTFNDSKSLFGKAVRPDLAFTRTNPDTVAAGSSFSTALNVENTGTATSYLTDLVDIYPKNFTVLDNGGGTTSSYNATHNKITWEIREKIAPTESARKQYTLQAPSGPMLHNFTSEWKYQDKHSLWFNNTENYQIDVLSNVASIDFSITPTAVNASETVNVTIDAANPTTYDAENVSTNVTIPTAWSTPTSIQPTLGDAAYADGVLTWENFTISASTNQSITFEVTASQQSGKNVFETKAAYNSSGSRLQDTAGLGITVYAPAIQTTRDLPGTVGVDRAFESKLTFDNQGNDQASLLYGTETVCENDPSSCDVNTSSKAWLIDSTEPDSVQCYADHCKYGWSSKNTNITYWNGSGKAEQIEVNMTNLTSATSRELSYSPTIMSVGSYRLYFNGTFEDMRNVKYNAETEYVVTVAERPNLDFSLTPLETYANNTVAYTWTVTNTGTEDANETKMWLDVPSGFGIDASSLNTSLGSASVSTGIIEWNVSERVKQNATMTVASQADWNKGTFNETSADRKDNSGTLGIGYRNGTSSDNLVGYWRFDRTSGDVLDYSGEGHDGSANNGVIRGRQGVFGTNAFSFDGTNDYVEEKNLRSQSPFADEITVAAWINTNEAQAEKEVAHGTDSSLSGHVFRLNLESSSNDLRWAVHISGGVGYPDGFFDSGYSVPTDTWTHVVGVYNGSHIRMYTNGERLNSTKQSQNGDLSPLAQTFIGAYNGSGSLANWYNGSMDEFRMYNRALSDTEIKQLYFNTTKDQYFEGNYTSKKIDAQGTGNWTDLYVNASDIPADTAVSAVFRALDSGGSVTDSQVISLTQGAQNYSLTVSNSAQAEVKFNGTSTNETQTWEIGDFKTYYTEEPPQVISEGATENLTVNITTSKNRGSYLFTANTSYHGATHYGSYTGSEDFDATVLKPVLTVDRSLPALVDLNTYFTAKLTLANNGNLEYSANATDVNITETMHQNFALDCGSVVTDKFGAVNCDDANNRITWHTLTLEPGEETTVSYDVQTNTSGDYQKNATTTYSDPVQNNYSTDSSGTVTVSDLTAPDWRNQQQGSTSITQSGSNELSARGYDFSNLSHAILATNETGTWENKTNYGSPMKLYKADMWAWSNFTWQNTSFSGAVSWKIYYNDTSGNYNATTTKTFTVSGGSSAYIEVNITRPISGIALAQNQTFTLNATVTCRNGSCGQVNGTARYNSTGTEPDTAVSAASGTPFHTQTKANPLTCSSSLGQDQSCNVTWTVNASGSIGSVWNVDVNFTSDAGVSSNDTANRQVEITGPVINMVMQWATTDFGTLDPKSTDNPATNNSDKLYNVTVTEDTTETVDLWINGTDLNQEGGSSVIGVTNISYHTQNSVGASSALSTEFSSLKTSVGPSTNVTTYYWLDVPGGIPADNYTGTIEVMANQTS